MIGINFYSAFLDSAFDGEYEALRAQYRDEIDSLWEVHKEDRDHYIEKRNLLLGNKFHAIRPPCERVVDHIDYNVKLVGHEYVGLGSDFDGTTCLPMGL
jgi:membrane dipeptidase